MTDATIASIAADLEKCDIGLLLTKGALRAQYVNQRKACFAELAAINTANGLDSLSDAELLAQLEA